MTLPPGARTPFFNARRLCLRIGECFRFGCDEPQTQRAAALVRRIVKEEQRIEHANKVKFETRKRETKIVAAPGRFQKQTIAAAHQQFAMDLAQYAIRRAYVVARGRDPQDVPDDLCDLNILAPQLRPRHLFPHEEPTGFLRGSDLVAARQTFRLLDNANSDGEGREPDWLTNVVCVKTRITSRFFPMHGPCRKVGVVEMCFSAACLPPDILEYLLATSGEDRSKGEGEGEGQYLADAVRELEKETWDREDAVEDVGGTK